MKSVGVGGRTVAGVFWGEEISSGGFVSLVVSDEKLCEFFWSSDVGMILVGITVGVVKLVGIGVIVIMVDGFIDGEMAIVGSVSNLCTGVGDGWFGMVGVTALRSFTLQQILFSLLQLTGRIFSLSQYFAGVQ